MLCLIFSLPNKLSPPLENLCINSTNILRQLSNLQKVKLNHVNIDNTLHRKSQELIRCARQDHNLRVIYRTGKIMSGSVTAKLALFLAQVFWKSSSPLGLYYAEQVDSTQKSVNCDNNWLSSMYSSHHISST